MEPLVRVEGSPSSASSRSVDVLSFNFGSFREEASDWDADRQLLDQLLHDVGLLGLLEGDVRRAMEVLSARGARSDVEDTGQVGVAIGDLTQEGRETLLGGTLYAYGNAEMSGEEEVPNDDLDAVPLAAVATSNTGTSINESVNSAVDGAATVRGVAVPTLSLAVLLRRASMQIDARSARLDGDPEVGGVDAAPIQTVRDGAGGHDRLSQIASSARTGGASVVELYATSSRLSDSPEYSARTVLSAMTDTPFDGDASMAPMLSGEGLTLDEALVRSIRRVLQLSTVLTGQRLTDEEVRQLPTVRFEEEELQQCSICLESYRRGEVLNKLHCAHFFHVDCLAHWMQRASQCPLCRTQCGQ